MHLIGLTSRLSFNNQSMPSSRCSYTTKRAFELDIHKTVQALASSKQCDLFSRDQYGGTIYHLIATSGSSFQWLLKQEAVQILNMSYEEVHDIFVSRCAFDPRDTASIRDVLSNKDILGRVARASLPEAHSWGYKTLLDFVATCTFGLRHIHASSETNAFILDLINAGSDLHALSTWDSSSKCLFTILLHLCTMLLTSRVSRCEQEKRIWMWLEALASAGVDLEIYGDTEHAMHRSRKVSWTFSINLERSNRATPISTENICTFQILEIHTGPSPEDWLIEWEDLYVSAALPWSFWRLVEGEIDEDDETENDEDGDEDFGISMPGSWPTERCQGQIDNVACL
jgi:hypothetical protein